MKDNQNNQRHQPSDSRGNQKQTQDGTKKQEILDDEIVKKDKTSSKSQTATSSKRGSDVQDREESEEDTIESSTSAKKTSDSASKGHVKK